MLHSQILPQTNVVYFVYGKYARFRFSRGGKPTGAVNMSSLIKVLSVRVLNESISFNFVVIVVVYLLTAFFH